MAKTTVRKINYKGWPNCYEIGNGTIDAVVTTDIGPRVIRFGFTGEGNEFCEHEGDIGTTGGSEWKIYGGHRLWHSPEHMPRTYELDNSPVPFETIENGIKITQPVEPWTQVVKEMEITMDPDKNIVHVLHRIINKGPWEIELSIWALTVMAPGGREVVPQSDRQTGLLPNRMVSLWPYSKMNDPRITWGDKYIMMDQDTAAATPFKFGMPNEDGWAALFNHDNLFIKSFDFYDEAIYPDYGASSYETYTNDFMTEMESLSPMSLIGCGESIEHEETWQLYKNVKKPMTEAEVSKILKKFKVVQNG